VRLVNPGVFFFGMTVGPLALDACGRGALASSWIVSPVEGSCFFLKEGFLGERGSRIF